LLVMRKQQEAPGELERVRAFVNTFDVDAATEQLTSAADLGDWLIRHDLAPAGTRATPADLRRAKELRESIRSVLLSHTSGTPVPPEAVRTFDQIAVRARLTLRFDERGGARLEPVAAGVDGALGRLLRIIQGAIADGTWARMKACREHTCEWAFYDHTKNRSGTWCTMQVCGNRTKARSYRERRARGDMPASAGARQT
jgi:predicted RNA-binding Zn ribbon-like protein